MGRARVLALLALASCLPQDLTFARRDASSEGGAGGEGGEGGEGGRGGEAAGGAAGEGGACMTGGCGGRGEVDCPRTGECQACLACSRRSTCQPEHDACDREPDCAALNACLAGCPPGDDATCFLDCHAMHRTGSPVWIAALECALCECSVRGFAAPCDQDAAMFCG